MDLGECVTQQLSSGREVACKVPPARYTTRCWSKRLCHTLEKPLDKSFRFFKDSKSLQAAHKGFFWTPIKLLVRFPGGFFSYSEGAYKLLEVYLRERSSLVRSYASGLSSSLSSNLTSSFTSSLSAAYPATYEVTSLTRPEACSISFIYEPSYGTEQALSSASLFRLLPGMG
jgi:hypothetical protein